MVPPLAYGSVPPRPAGPVALPASSPSPRPPVDEFGGWDAAESPSGEVYFFHRASNRTVWALPPEWAHLKERLVARLKASEEAAWAAAEAAAAARAAAKPKEEAPAKEKAPTEEAVDSKEGLAAEKGTAGRAGQSASGGAAAEDEGESRHGGGVEEEVEEEVEDGDDEEEDAAPLTEREKRRLAVYLTQLGKDFFGLLRSVGAGPHSVWKEVLPRIATDERFTAVPAMEQRQALFQLFLRRARAEATADTSATRDAARAKWRGWVVAAIRASEEEALASSASPRPSTLRDRSAATIVDRTLDRHPGPEAETLAALLGRGELEAVAREERDRLPEADEAGAGDDADDGGEGEGRGEAAGAARGGGGEAREEHAEPDTAPRGKRPRPDAEDGEEGALRDRR